MDIKYMELKALDRAMSANEYWCQVEWCKEVGTDTPEDYIDRMNLTIEDCLRINQYRKLYD